MTQRVDRILTQLASTHAPHLLATGMLDGVDRVRHLATGLAKNGVLVLIGDLSRIDPAQHNHYIHQWVSEYANLYGALTRTLFPSYTRFTPVYADDQTPPIVVLFGHSTPVMEKLSFYVAPYVALRHDDRLFSKPEVRGIMHYMLDELELQDITQMQYGELIRDGMRSISGLLHLPFRQIALTVFEQSLFENNGHVGRPDTLPETGGHRTMTGRLFSRKIDVALSSSEPTVSRRRSGLLGHLDDDDSGAIPRPPLNNRPRR